MMPYDAASGLERLEWLLVYWFVGFKRCHQTVKPASHQSVLE
jgi:hypothetical protein